MNKRTRWIIIIGSAIFMLFSVVALTAQRIPRFIIKEESARGYFQKGLYFHNSQNYVAAREFFYKALAKKPQFHLAQRYLGDSYYYAGEWGNALDQWQSLNTLAGGAYPLVRQRSELLRFNLNQYKKVGKYTYLDSITPRTWRGYRFSRPVDVALDEDNNLYVLSYESRNILKVSPGRRPKNIFRGSIINPLKGPLAMALNKKRLYVCDYSADMIRTFSLSGVSREEFGGKGSGDGLFHGPSGIVVTGEHIFVSDTGNRRIQKFTLAGKFVSAFGADDRGRSPESPAGLAVDGEGTLYLADSHGRRILKYDQDGRFLGDIRSSFIRAPRGLHIHKNKLLVADEKNGVGFFDLRETKWTRLKGLRNEKDRPLLFDRAFAARTGANGVLYIAEYGAQRVMTVVPRGLRTSNLDIKIQRIDTRAFPDLAVFATVRNRLGRDIPGLSRTEIRLYENDNRVGGIRTDSVRVFNKRTNIALVKENSPFFRKQYESYLAHTTKGLLTKLRIADRLKVIRVGEQVRQVYKGLQRRKIVSYLLKGETTKEPNLGKGLYEALTRMLPELGPRYVVLLTSGKYYENAFNQYSVQRIVQYAESQGIGIHVVSYEGENNPNLNKRMREAFDKLTHDTGGKYYSAFDETALMGMYAEIRKKKDKRYIITYERGDEGRVSGRYTDVRAEVHYLKTYGKGDGGYFIP